MGEVCETPGVDVFVDTNILLAPADRKFWASDIDQMLVTREVIREIRKRPENSGANQFIDECQENSRVFRVMVVPTNMH